jgi:DNA repair protein RecN (Recombination protein N)
LSIQNLATIEQLTVAFGPGLQALTGETGAGKSILVEGLGLALGQRASAESIRQGASLAVAEATFLPPFPPALKALIADELGLEFDPDAPLELRREIAASGKNRCLANGQLLGVADLARLGDLMADFHGQHEHQSLLRKGAAREALDAFAAHDGLLEARRAAWEDCTRLRRRREALEAAAHDFDRRADYLNFQLDELDKLAPRLGELAELEQEEHRLARSEEVTQAAAEAYGLLYEGLDDERPALLATLSEARRRLAVLAEVLPEFAGAPDRLDEQKAALEDLAFALRDFAQATPADPERLGAVIERSEALRHLARKHGGSEETLQEAWQAMRAERDRMSLDQEERLQIDRQLERAEAGLSDADERLSASRRRAAGRFAKSVAGLLDKLGMEKARFEVAIEPLTEPASHGADEIDFLLAANPGLPPAPLRKIGSGGELSRVMLALKSTLAARDHVPTLVFDEIDAGVSGQTAARVGRMLEQLGQSHQILCITHHAPIAARAASQASVRKRAVAGTTYTEVVALEGEGRLEELARMMGGDGQLASARELARALMA